MRKGFLKMILPTRFPLYWSRDLMTSLRLSYKYTNVVMSVWLLQVSSSSSSMLRMIMQYQKVHICILKVKYTKSTCRTKNQKLRIELSRTVIAKRRKTHAFIRNKSWTLTWTKIHPSLNILWCVSLQEWGEVVLGKQVAIIMPLFVMCSTFGAANGALFAGVR